MNIKKLHTGTCSNCYCNVFKVLPNFTQTGFISGTIGKCVECGSLCGTPIDKVKVVYFKVYFKKELTK